ncbi:UDP-glucose 4-epimerase GalE [Parasedimentitalea marina]|uniref:UDP-glucose 4-epimerase n=1 Tax=Parasedimentitalea marina TaxID=2483033 RepID=A0A3T0N1X2_9RHOB|nr:UDP-glucose 4-epimerase GalE [Parasedimentitalea marina]AZV78023.1 UDP-glucose 4-epimerase GalE [Parasedimentitalea marina]
MTRTSVLVTGGAGFIGSHTCLQLAAAGFLPVVIDNLRTGHAEAVKWGPLERVDIRNSSAVASVIKKYHCKIVIHFAAAAYVGESVISPGLYYDNNVGGMIGLINAMQSTNTRSLVFSSSCATYGIPDRQPIRENTHQNPINPYGRTKLICEDMIKDHAAAWDLNYAMLRYFNACGADPSGRLSERHDPETHLIPLALMATAGARPGLKVFGTDYPTPDGTCIRDYIHVADLARAHVLAVERLIEAERNLALNLGSGKGHSILEIIAAIEDVTGRKTPWTGAERRAGDPPVLVADTALAKQELGFTTCQSDLHNILADAAPSFGLEALDDLRA